MREESHLFIYGKSRRWLVTHRTDRHQTGATSLEQVNPLIKRIPDPYGGKDVIVVPALNPDVAIVHVQRADKNGNAHLWGIIGEQKEAAFAAKKVILTAEEIVDESVIRSDPNRTMIPANIVDAVCHVPFASHPSYSQGKTHKRLKVKAKYSEKINYGKY